jgi:protein-disulfide isomerase
MPSTSRPAGSRRGEDSPQGLVLPPLGGTDVDELYGAEEAAGRLTQRLARVQPNGTGTRLQPPFAPSRDHSDGPVSAPVTMVVFGAYATPFARPLGELLKYVREQHVTTVRVAWRHFPDPPAHPHSAVFALAAEAAATRGKFWVLTRALLAADHDDPRALHDAILHAGMDPESTLAAMRAGIGSDRIVDDTASAYASAVAASPTIFIGRERYDGELTPAAIEPALGV